MPWLRAGPASRTERLEPGVTFAGRVTDIRGHPVPGAEVHFSTMQGAVSAPTGGDGRFQFEGAPETYTLTARKAGLAPATLDLQAMRSRDRQAIVLELGHLVTVARA